MTKNITLTPAEGEAPGYNGTYVDGDGREFGFTLNVMRSGTDGRILAYHIKYTKVTPPDEPEVGKAIVKKYTELKNAHHEN